MKQRGRGKSVPKAHGSDSRGMERTLLTLAPRRDSRGARIGPDVDRRAQHIEGTVYGQQQRRTLPQAAREKGQPDEMHPPETHDCAAQWRRIESDSAPLSGAIGRSRGILSGHPLRQRTGTRPPELPLGRSAAVVDASLALFWPVDALETSAFELLDHLGRCRKIELEGFPRDGVPPAEAS